MSEQPRVFFIALLILLVAATLQAGEFLTLLGVKPNLILVLFVILSVFTRQFFLYGLLVLFGITALDFVPGVSWESSVLLFIALLFFYIRDRFLSAGLFVVVLFSVCGTVLFYLLVSPTMLYDEVAVVTKELVYNVLIGVILFGLIGFYYEKKGGSSIR